MPELGVGVSEGCLDIDCNDVVLLVTSNSSIDLHLLKDLIFADSEFAVA